MYCKRHADTDEALDFCKQHHLLLALDSETPQDQLRAACRIANSAFQTWKDEIAAHKLEIVTKHVKKRADDENEQETTNNSNAFFNDDIFGSRMDEEKKSTLEGGDDVFGQKASVPNSSFSSSSSSDSSNNTNNIAMITSIFHGPAYFFNVGFLRLRRLAHSRFRLRDIFKKYIHRRRNYIESALQQWREKELAARVNMSFAQYVLVYVPPELRRQVLVDFHCACAHQCMLFLRATRTDKEKQLKLRKSFFIWAYHQRTVSSTTFRIALVALYIFKERARKRAWVRSLMNSKKELFGLGDDVDDGCDRQANEKRATTGSRLGKNANSRSSTTTSRVSALLLSGCTSPTRWCKSLLSLQSLAWCSAVRKYSLKMLTGMKPVLVFKELGDEEEQHDEAESFSSRSSSLLEKIKKNNNSNKDESLSRSSSIRSTLSNEAKLRIPSNKLVLCFSPWSDQEITTAWFSIHLQQFARELANMMMINNNKKKRIEGDGDDDGDENEMEKLDSQADAIKKAESGNISSNGIDWSQFLVSSELFDPFCFVDLVAVGGDSFVGSTKESPEEQIRKMLIARSTEVDKVLVAKSLTNKNQQFSSIMGSASPKGNNSNNNKSFNAQNEYMFRAGSLNNHQQVETQQQQQQHEQTDSFVAFHDNGALTSKNRISNNSNSDSPSPSSSKNRRSSIRFVSSNNKSNETDESRKSTTSLAPTRPIVPAAAAAATSSFRQRRKSLTDSGNNNNNNNNNKFASFSYSNRKRNMVGFDQSYDEQQQQGDENPVDVDNPNSTFRTAVNNLLTRSSSALHLPTSKSFKISSSYTAVAVEKTTTKANKHEYDTYYYSTAPKELHDVKFISKSEMRRLAQVLAKSQRCPTLWGKHWLSDPHWRGRVMNIQSDWSPLDWNNPESAKYAGVGNAPHSSTLTAYRRVLRFCIVSGALRVTDPFRWKQVEKLNAMMMYESVFKQMREERFLAARRHRKRKLSEKYGSNDKQNSSGFASFIGVRDTVLSMQEAVTSMSRRRNRDEIAVPSCELFGELSAIQPNDVLIVEKSSICALSGMNFADSKKDFLKQKVTSKKSFVPKMATIVLTSDNSGHNNNSAEKCEQRAKSPRQPSAVKHSFCLKNRNSSSLRPSSREQHKLVIVDENVVKEEQTTRLFVIGPPKQKSGGSVDVCAVRRKLGASASASQNVVVNIQHRNNNAAQDENVVTKNADGDRAVVTALETFPVSVSRSELHQRQKEWTSQEATEENVAPEPFGFNVGFPAIWRCIAGKESRSLPANVKRI